MAQTMLKPGPGNLRCTLTCWAAGLVVGAGATLAARILATIEWNGAVFIGALAFLVAGGLMSFLFCRPLPTLADVEARRAAKGAGAPVTPAAGASAAPVAAPPVAPEAAAPRDRSASIAAPAAAAPAAAAPVAAAPVVSDPVVSDPVVSEPLAAGSPAPASGAGVAAPALDGADDLTRISGVGPVLSAALNAEGVTRFEQIAAWSPDEAARFDAAVAGGRGRVMRDDWVGQARALASGGH